MQLFYKPGACSLASHIVLNELAFTFTLEKTDTAKAITASGIDYRTINPNGYVPALQTDDGDIITENTAILQYLADSAPAAGLAPTPGTLARTRLHEILSFLSTELHKAYGPYFSGEALAGERKRAVERKLAARIDTLSAHLGDGRTYLLGEQYSVADAYAFVLLSWSFVIDHDLAQWPALVAYFQRIRSRPAVVNAMTAEGLRAAELAS
ncbi:MAG: glutathione S-transferase C-terminal domain-containing protein [Pseudomonadota bacterium]